MYCSPPCALSSPSRTCQYVPVQCSVKYSKYQYHDTKHYKPGVQDFKALQLECTSPKLECRENVVVSNFNGDR